MENKKSKKVEIKTKENKYSVEEFLGKLDNEQKRKDCFSIIAIMQKASGAKAKMWGSSIIGFGNRVARSEKTGREVDWLLIGFSPRKANISLYLSISLTKHQDLLTELGKYKTGGGCLYINKLGDIDLAVLQKLIELSLEQFK